MEPPHLVARRQMETVALASRRLALETSRLGRWGLQEATKDKPASSCSSSSLSGWGLARL